MLVVSYLEGGCFSMGLEPVQESKKVRYDQIDALKGIAIFTVVLVHGVIVYPIDLHQNVICDFLCRWLSSAYMPLLFIVSGFCFSYQQSYQSFLWKKVKRLLIPYIVFNTADVFSRTLFPNAVNISRGIRESIIKIILNGGEYWFLYTLFIIFLLYPFIYKLVKDNIYRSVGVLAFILLLHYIVPSTGILRWNSVIYYLFYFMLGGIIKNFYGGKVFEMKLDRRKTSFAVLVLFAIWLSLIQLDVSMPHIVALLGIVTYYICLQYDLIVQIFKRFGKYSLQLYLFNGYLLVISRSIIVTVLGVTSPGVIIAFNMLVDFFASYVIIKYICEKIKPVRFLLGM